MFGLFKSKDDKEAERIVSELRESKEPIIIEGNVVYELGSIITKRYKLTASTTRAIESAGILQIREDSGAAVIAVNKSEVVYIEYGETGPNTAIFIMDFSADTLKDVKAGLDRNVKIATKDNGFSYSNRSMSMGIMIGIITALRCEVGTPQADYENDYPFNYKNHTFSIIEQDDAIWVVYVEKSN